MEKKGLGEQKPKKTKKTKKTILHGLTQDSSHRIVFFGFFGFFGFLRVFGQVGLGEEKTSRKTKKNKKTKKTILHGLTQDSSHRIVFFVFFGFFGCLRVFGQVGLGEQKTSRNTKKKQKNKKKQFCMDLPKILLTGLFFLVFSELLDIWKAGNGKKGKKQNVQKPNAPSVAFCISYVPTSLGRSADILTFHCHFGAAAAFVPRPVVVPMKPKKVR